MGHPIYVEGNDLIAAVVTASSEDPVYPLSMLYDEVLGYPFRFATGAGGWIDMDVGSADVDTLVIANHNFAETAVITIASGPDPSPGGGTAVAWRRHDIWSPLPLSGQRYHRLTVSDDNEEYTEIGELLLRKRTTLTSLMSFGWSRSPGREKIDHRTVRGVKHIYQLHDLPRFEAVFESIQDWHIEELDLLDELVRGSELPFAWIVDEAKPDVYYVRKIDDHRVRSIRFNEWAVTLIFEMESRGVNLR